MLKGSSSKIHGSCRVEHLSTVAEHSQKSGVCTARVTSEVPFGETFELRGCWDIEVGNRNVPEPM